MVERIFAEQMFAVCLIDGDQPRDQCTGRSGFRIGDGLVPGNVARSGLKRDVRQPEKLDPALIAETEINAFCGA